MLKSSKVITALFLLSQTASSATQVAQKNYESLLPKTQSQPTEKDFVLDDYLKSQKDYIQACVSILNKTYPEIVEVESGDVNVKAITDENGKVTQATLKNGTFRHPQVGECIRSTINKWRVPKKIIQKEFVITTYISCRLVDIKKSFIGGTVYRATVSCTADSRISKD